MSGSHYHYSWPVALARIGKIRNMKKQTAFMPTLEVLLERLPQAVIDSAIAPARVLQEISLPDESSQSILLKSVKTKLMQDAWMKSMPCLQVSLERLPENLMASLLVQKKINLAQQKRKVGRPKKMRNAQFKNQTPMFDFISV